MTASIYTVPPSPSQPPPAAVTLRPRRGGAGQGVGAAQRVRDPEPAGHPPHQVGRVGAGHPRRGDQQRARRGPAQHRYGVGGRPEPRLGHADHRDAELGVRVGAEPRPAERVEIGVPVDDQQAKPHPAQDRPQRRQLPEVELARPVRRRLGQHRDVLGQHPREHRVGGDDRRRPGPAGRRVVNVGGRERAAGGLAAVSHPTENASRGRAALRCRFR
jgi:hypothetical protein